MKLICIFVLVLGLLIRSFSSVNAIVDPLSVSNNKYGIHVIDENDLYDAANLVNSSGGDWGYVTMVITDTDRNIEKWQKNMDLMRSLHLIPIIRLATHSIGDIWEKPKAADAKDWADFLSNLYWVTKNRYVVIFNEPNHAKEWGGNVNPAEYAEILTSFAINLKKASADFFILPAGFDASAPNGKDTMDEVDFVDKMLTRNPDVFNYVDGWTSHSYPNPGFAGKVTDTGRGTLSNFKWELRLLKSKEQKDDFPIFITETGWAHADGVPRISSYFSAETISQFIKDADSTVWNDPQIVAITPFVLNYPAYPFSNFSWKKIGGDGFYPFYESYKAIPKTGGKPEFTKAFDKFEGLDIQNLPNKDNSTNLRYSISIFTYPYWRSIFSRMFNL